MRILGIDYGDSRIGLSVCDELQILSSPLKTCRSLSMRKDIDNIAAIAKEENAGLIVLGLPLNMDSSEGARANKTRAFGKNLEKVSGIKVEYFDERLTTVEAEELLRTSGVKKSRRDEIIDSVSAQIILQGYLDKHKRNLK